jgi:hypothetical protein
VILVNFTIHFDVPEKLFLISGNMANLAALIFPVLLIFLNRQLPKPARSSRWAIFTLILNSMFFGLFFIRYVLVELMRIPLLPF